MMMIEGARRGRAPQMEALVTLEPLTSVPDVAVEAWIRIGLVHFTVGDYASALRAFEAAQPIATETSLKYLAYFNAGRALEGLQRIDDAIRAYQRALEIVPGRGVGHRRAHQLAIHARRSRGRRVVDRSRLQSQTRSAPIRAAWSATAVSCAGPN